MAGPPHQAGFAFPNPNISMHMGVYDGAMWAEIKAGLPDSHLSGCLPNHAQAVRKGLEGAPSLGHEGGHEDLEKNRQAQASFESHSPPHSDDTLSAIEGDFKAGHEDLEAD